MTTAKAQLLTVLQHADYQDRRPTLNLAFAIDQNYLKPCGICLNSVALNNPDLAIDFYIFTTFFDNFGFEQIVAQFPNIRIHIYQLNSQYFDSLQTNYHFTTAIYYRLSIADILEDKVEQFMYLDSDIVCDGSLAELGNLHLEQHVIAAVEDKFISRNYIQSLGLPESHRYFNSGVMLINIQNWHDFGVMDQFDKLINQRQYKYPDQDVLNIILQDRIYYLDSKYNDVTQGTLENAALIHFVSSPKPWCIASEPRPKYLQYYALSPWKDECLDAPRNAKECKSFAKKLKGQGNYWESLKWQLNYYRHKTLK